MVTDEPLKQDIIERFGTPCAVIDLDVVDRNIAHLQSLCDAAGLANRPHIKTHKSPFLAKRQLAAGAVGITCQKLGEAEVMAEAGVGDILIATNIIGAARSGRLAVLQHRMSLKICADNPVSLAAPSIRAGVNQTIMLSLGMVVVASLIGAKGLGEDVLEALQYANVGQGILAGFAILFCAMMLDRIVQGRNR